MNQLDQVENTIWFRFNFDWVNSVRFVFFCHPYVTWQAWKGNREREEKGFSLGQRERDSTGLVCGFSSLATRSRMFKKAVEAKSHQRLSGADRKKLRRTVQNRFSLLTDELLDASLPPKV